MNWTRTVLPDLRRLVDVLRRSGVGPRVFVLPMCLSSGAALFEGVSVGLLMPLLRGIIERDFGFIYSLPVLGVLFGSGSLPSLGAEHAFAVLIVATFASILAKNVLIYASTRIALHSIQRFTSRLKQQLFERQLQFGKLYFDRNSKGHLQTLVSEYPDKIGHALAALQRIATWMLISAVYVLLMVHISPGLTAVTLLFLPVLHVSMSWLVRSIERSSERLIDTDREFVARIFDVLGHMSLVKAYVTERREARAFAQRAERVAAAEFEIFTKEALVGPFQEIVSMSAVLILVSAVAVYWPLGQDGHVAGFFVFFYLVKRTVDTFNAMGSTRAFVAGRSGFLTEIQSVFDNAGKFPVEGGTRELEPLREGIEVVSLSFSYNGSTPVLRDVSFTIPKGEMTAIVGETGAGKTTLINLLLRFYDCPPGTILIDGVDIRELTSASVRSAFASVSQDVFVFNDSLRSNIRYGSPDATEEEILAVVAGARLGELVASLPRGLDTVVGDRGVQLSGGEKQRVAIARASLKRSAILLLDEATSSLDTKTEQLVQSAIQEAVRHRTAIVVAHRLSTITKADQIVVMSRGRVIETGTLHALRDKRGAFFEMWEAQTFA